MEKFEMVMAYLRGAAKAVGAGAVAAIGSLLLLLSGTDSLDTVTTAEWLLVALNVLGAYGVVYRLPNKS